MKGEPCSRPRTSAGMRGGCSDSHPILTTFGSDLSRVMVANGSVFLKNNDSALSGVDQQKISFIFPACLGRRHRPIRKAEAGNGTTNRSTRGSRRRGASSEEERAQTAESGARYQVRGEPCEAAQSNRVKPEQPENIVLLVQPLTPSGGQGLRASIHQAFVARTSVGTPTPSRSATRQERLPHAVQPRCSIQATLGP